MPKMLWRPRILAVIALCALLVNVAACARPAASVSVPPVGNPQFSRTPPVANWSDFKKKWTQAPVKPQNEGEPFGVDLRLADISGVDLGESRDVLLNYATFDTDTRRLGAN